MATTMTPHSPTGLMHRRPVQARVSRGPSRHRGHLPLSRRGLRTAPHSAGPEQAGQQEHRRLQSRGNKPSRPPRDPHQDTAARPKSLRLQIPLEEDSLP